ncbi:TonB-dependent receptor [Nibrella saemangeumensis]|uniref:TonB-dependent receptor n=2 Tax=Nibrella saemangeumensis TaxID=1084526 RepID=A0ABP8MXZ8_9BACT
MLAIVGTSFAHDTHAQEYLNRRVTLNLEEKEIRKVLALLEKVTEVRFMYSSQVVQGNPKVSLHVANEPLGEVLDRLLKPLRIQYELIGNKVVLTSVSTSLNLSNLTMRMAQELATRVDRTITGTITAEENGAPLPGVNVIVKGSIRGATSDVNGKYSLAIPDNAVTLIFSFIGYETQEVAVGNRLVVDVNLKVDVRSLNEVVVIGYGTQRKRDVTGAVSQVKADEIKGLPLTGLDQAIQGRAAGVQVTQNSGAPGGSVSVRIRGVGTVGTTTDRGQGSSANEPLYVVDGLPTGSLNAINPNDIESIEILKDAASASIYGSRAANGVVLVTTRRGKEGRTRIEFDSYVGVQTPARKIEVLNGPEFATLANESVTNSNNDPRTTVPKNNPLNPLWANPSSLPTYDWQDAIFQNGAIQNYNFTLSGGTAKSRTAASFSYFRQDGLIINSFYQRFTGRINSDYQVGSRLRFGHTLNIARDNQQVVPIDRDYDGILQTAYQMHPMQPIYAADGLQSPTLFGLGGYSHFPLTTEPRYYPRQLYNPLYRTKVVENDRVNLRMLGLVFGELDIIQGLTFRTSLGIELGNSGSTGYTPFISANIFGNTTRADANEDMSRSYQWNWINTLNFSRTFNERHVVSALAGIDALKGQSSYLSGNANTFVNPNVRAFGFTEQKNRNVGNSLGDFALLSYIGRLSYAYDDKYLVQFNIRRDGSPNFGPENQFGLFPSVSAGWRLSREGFLRNNSFVNDLKLRASWGVLGNQNIPNFQYMNTLSSNEIEYSLGTGAQAAATGITVRSLANPAIKWESTTQIDVGIDASLMQGRINIVADYYDRETRDMLVRIPVPMSLGAPNNSILRNAGGMRNSGFEFAVGYRANSGKVRWSADVNLATLRNRVTSLGDGGRPIVRNMDVGQNNANSRTEVGQPIAYFWGYQTAGIFQSQQEIDGSPMKEQAIPGDRQYIDINGDGKVDGNDRTNLGSGLPKLIFGGNVRADYKNFDVTLFLQGQAGNKIANNNRRHLYDIRNYNGQGVQNVAKEMMNRWTGPGTSNTIPRVAYFTASDNNRFSDFYVEEGGFVRCRNFQIGYTLPQNLTKRLSGDRLRVYVAAQNLFTITRYSGYDPEVGSLNQDVLNTGFDMGRYPVARTLMGGLNLSF